MEPKRKSLHLLISKHTKVELEKKANKRTEINASVIRA